MSSKAMQGAYIVYNGSSTDEGGHRSSQCPSVAMPNGAIALMRDIACVEAFAAAHQLDAADFNELLAIQSIASSQSHTSA